MTFVTTFPIQNILQEVKKSYRITIGIGKNYRRIQELQVLLQESPPILQYGERLQDRSTVSYRTRICNYRKGYQSYSTASNYRTVHQYPIGRLYIVRICYYRKGYQSYSTARTIGPLNSILWEDYTVRTWCHRKGYQSYSTAIDYNRTVQQYPLGRSYSQNLLQQERRTNPIVLQATRLHTFSSILQEDNIQS